MKKSINNTFTAEKMDTLSIDGKTRVNQYVRISANTGGFVGVMLSDYTINVIIGNANIDQVKELTDFLDWIKENFWNI